MFTAAAILLAALLISFSIWKGLNRMSETIEQATSDLIDADTSLIKDVTAALTDIANSISDRVANGTATTAILAEVAKLKALDTSVLVAETPVVVPAPAPVPTPAPTPEPVPALAPPTDTATGAQGTDTVAAPSGNDTVSGV